MKNLLKILALSAICVSFFTACSDNDDVSLGANANVITCNGKVCAHLVSAFSGGGVADPEVGAYTRLNIFDKNFSSYPSNEAAKVSIRGLFRPNKTYNGNGDYLEAIVLCGVDKYDVNISLNQGVYEGKDGVGEPDTHVSSVTIHSYSLEEIDTNDKRKRYANIHITIKMADSTVIEIKYSGIVSSDQMYG